MPLTRWGFSFKQRLITTSLPKIVLFTQKIRRADDPMKISELLYKPNT
jgi:hypothetical protein